ncbi:MAG: outer membrane beta-barrel protein [Prevotella sp.]|nr:outer membrane beta-barrel protein [Prevotella sp.]
MKKKMTITILCLSAITQMMAQNITGKVVDTKGEPLAFANVVLLNRQDSAFVKGAVSGEDGSFSIDSTCNGGIIKVTSVGYKTICKDCMGENVGVIKMEEDSKMLGEVVVKSSLPKTILKNGGMTTTVVGSVLEKAGNMENLLDRIPNVSAQNGSIKVFGHGEPVIYINGRQMRDKSELDRLHSDNIKSVEVITTPGARYAASTKAVIRITTKKMQGEGFGFDASTTGEYDEKKNFGGFSQLNMSYRKNGLELGAFAFGARQYQPGDKDLQQKTYLDKTWNQKGEIRQVGIIEAMNFRLDASYQLDANNSIGANFGFLRNPKETWDGDMATSIWQDEEQTENSNSLADFFEQKTTLSSNVYYVGKVGKLNIDFNTDWLWSKNYENDVNKEQYQEVGMDAKSQTVNSLTDKAYHLLASKLVLSYPLLGGELSLGGEYSNTHRTSKYQVVPTNFVSDDNSRITEGMTSSFLTYSRDFGDLSMEAGLRYEYIDFNYYEYGKYMPGQSKSYGNWFPSLSLSMPVGKVQMQLSYAADISRPSYYNLRSGVQYDNRYTYETGNPFLVSEISRNLNYELAYKWLTFDMTYSHTSHPILSNVETYKDNPAIGLMKPVNGKAYNHIESSINLRPSFGIWHPSFTASVAKQWLDMDTHDGKLSNNPMASFRFNNTFNTKLAMFTWMMSYITKGYSRNQYLYKPMFCTNISVYKVCLKNRLSLQLFVYDLFGTNDSHMIAHFGKMKEMVYDGLSTSKVSLTVRYKFNTTRSKYKGTGAGQEQKNRM